MSRSTFDKEQVLNNISVVLVDPQVPENIGLAGRVMKNTGFSSLVLVGSPPENKSLQVAKRARDIVSQARVCASLDQALADSCFVFGTTRRSREYKTIYDIHAVLPQLVASASRRKVSILFGKEDFGLSRRELECCDSIFYIPAAEKFPSYNLAFSVGIVCYLIFDYCSYLFAGASLDLARKKDIEPLYEYMRACLSAHLGGPARAETMVRSLRRILNRTLLTGKEAELLKAIFLKLT